MPKFVVADKRGRLSLSRYLKPYARYQVKVDNSGHILLVPMVSISLHEYEELKRAARISKESLTST